MKLPGALAVAVVAAAGLASCGSGDETAAAAGELMCPDTAYLNCMPIVPPARREICAPENREWVATNCPGVEIVF